jgi:hypothetical protein
MAEMGNYCKAYEAKQLRAYPGWSEKVENLRPETKEVDGEEVEVPRTELKDDDILYIQETYIVTDGIFKDEHVVFDAVTDEWKRWVETDLQPEPFEIPHYEPIEIEVAETEGGGEPPASGGEAAGGGGQEAVQ